MSRINPLLLKLLSIAALMLVLLLPLQRVESLIAERATARATAVERVASSSGHEQRIGAAIIVVPVTRSGSVDGKPFSQIRKVRVLAKGVAIKTTVITEIRRSGIYRIPIFRAAISITGSLPTPLLMNELSTEPGVEEHIGRPRLFLAVSDLAGIRSLDGIKVDGAMLAAFSDTEDGLSGIAAELPPLGSGETAAGQFSVDLTVSGTERLQWLPLAESTDVQLASAWPDPAFSGIFAPQHPNITQRGFTADWRVLQINRDFPQRWIDDAVTKAQIERQSFGVDFYQPVDTYQQNYRSIHYAILMVAVTYLAMFLWEHIVGRAVHPMQYAMVGTALSLFYLLLLAMSEHLSFGASYGVAGAAITLLLACYFAGALGSARAGVIAGSLVGASYLLLFWLILSVDYALLCGTLALFMLLASIMVATRHLNWYAMAARVRGV